MLVKTVVGAGRPARVWTMRVGQGTWTASAADVALTGSWHRVKGKEADRDRQLSPTRPSCSSRRPSPPASPGLRQPAASLHPRADRPDPDQPARRRSRHLAAGALEATPRWPSRRRDRTLRSAAAISRADRSRRDQASPSARSCASGSASSNWRMPRRVERLPHARREQAEPLQVRHDAHEQHLAEHHARPATRAPGPSPRRGSSPSRRRSGRRPGGSASARRRR